MKSGRKATRHVFSLVLTMSILLGGFNLSNQSGGWLVVSGLAVAPLSAQGDQGRWELINNGLTNLAVAALAIDLVNPDRIFAGTIGGGFFKSTDGGATWSSVGLNVRFGTALAINPVSPNVMYAGTAEGGFCNALRPLFTSTNDGANWTNQRSMVDCDISLIVIDPTSPSTLYAGSSVQFSEEGGIILWKSTDGGATWNATPRIGNPGLASFGLTINPANSQVLYAPGNFSNGGVSGLFTSENGGWSWTPTGLTNTYVRAVAIDPFNPGTLYAGSASNSWAEMPFRGMFKSTDGGVSWLQINNGFANITAIYNIVVDRDNTNVLYIGTDGGVFKSVDGGANWNAFNNGLTNLEVFNLALAPGQPNTLYAGTRIGVFKVIDNVPDPNSIDFAEFFVRRHYSDFLNREPDAGGWAYWSNEITQCGSDAACIHKRRIGVSAAFFIEQEFQETGYFVYRFYKASFNRVPNFGEFNADRSRIMDGANLEVNKQAFADEWVQRPAFVAAYPITMGNTEVVNKLFDSAGLTASRYDSLRQQEISAMNAGRSRAMVLRDVIEIADFKNVPDPHDARYNELKQVSQYNPAFVLMQYFGYLRRDVDQSGYAFWLDVVNNREPNDYRGMVCAFITSNEYQLRFGSTVTRSNADCSQ